MYSELCLALEEAAKDDSVITVLTGISIHYLLWHLFSKYIIQNLSMCMSISLWDQEEEGVCANAMFCHRPYRMQLELIIVANQQQQRRDIFTLSLMLYQGRKKRGSRILR